MVNLLSCINNILIFVLLVIPGIILRRKNIISENGINTITQVLMNVLLPAMLIHIMTSVEVSDELLTEAVYVGVIAAIVYGISIILGIIYLKMRKIDAMWKGIMAFAIFANNTGFIGIPFIGLAFGEEAMFFASICEFVNDIFVFSVGLFLVQWGSRSRGRLKWKDIMSPVFVSLLIGIFLLAMGISLPRALDEALGYYGDATTAIALFVVGLQLGEMSFKQIFGQKRTYEVVLFRMIIIPLLLLFALHIVDSEFILADKVLVISFAMPVATTTAVLARQYRLDYKFATGCVMISTVFLAVTLPVWYLIVAGF